jgi:hypothetical protein
MIFQDMPLWLIVVATIFAVVLSIELGYRLGNNLNKRIEVEKESPVSVISGAILGLLAFMLAFVFGILYNRFEARKGLVREESLAISKVWLRSDFMSEPDRGKSVKLLKEYLDTRVSSLQSGDKARIILALKESDRIQAELWDMAVVNARKDMNSDVAALYIEALNEMMDIHDMRVIRGLQAKTPLGLWLGLYAILFLGMFSIGYQTAIVQSRRSLATLLLALSFTIMFILITTLDRPLEGFFKVPQQPLLNLQAKMAGKEIPAE